MLTFLDLLVVVFVEMSILSLIALCLMFMIRKPIVRKVCFYIVVALGIYVATVGARIGRFLFPLQTAMAGVVAITSIVALVMALKNKGNEQRFLTARIMATVSLVVGMFNAFIF